MVALIFAEILETCKLCPLVAGRLVDQTCVGLAPTAKEARTNIYDLGLAVKTFCSMAASSTLDNHSGSHRLMAAFECFLFVYFEMAGFTPCAPNELPTSMHAQSKKNAYRKRTGDVRNITSQMLVSSLYCLRIKMFASQGLDALLLHIAGCSRQFLSQILSPSFLAALDFW